MTSNVVPIAPDAEDVCGICNRLLHIPTGLQCFQGHAACHTCMLAWAALSEENKLPIYGEPFPKVLTVQDITFSCPMCRHRGEAEPDRDRAKSLQEKYPLLSELREMSLYTGSIQQDMVFCIGITEGNVLDAFSEAPGIIHSHPWKFFLLSSRPDIIESVDIILDPAFSPPCLLTLTDPPYTVNNLGDHDIVAIFVTLKPGWIWQEDKAVLSGGFGSGAQRNELEFLALNAFQNEGGQEVCIKTYQKYEPNDTVAETSLIHVAEDNETGAGEASSAVQDGGQIGESDSVEFDESQVPGCDRHVLEEMLDAIGFRGEIRTQAIQNIGNIYRNGGPDQRGASMHPFIHGGFRLAQSGGILARLLMEHDLPRPSFYRLLGIQREANPSNVEGLLSAQEDSKIDDDEGRHNASGESGEDEQLMGRFRLAIGMLLELNKPPLPNPLPSEALSTIQSAQSDPLPSEALPTRQYAHSDPGHQTDDH